MARNEVVRVVLHERGAAGEPLGDHLQRPQHHRRLPVALGPEAEAVGHQALHGQTGQLAQPAEILEVGRERLQPAPLEERTQAELDARPVAQGLVALTALAQLGDDVVGVLVLGDEGVDVRVGGGVDRGDQIVDAPRVDGDPEAQLGLDLVALGHRDLAHVVAEAGELERAELGQAGRRARPRGDAGGDRRVGHVAGDRLARRADPAQDVGELTVAVGGLVEVHEVHVDLRPRELDVGLGVQVQHRLLQRLQAVDPHLRRGERVHPRDHADAPVVGVDVEELTVDRVLLLEHGLEHDRHRDRPGGVELADDRFGLVGHLTQRLVAVQVLAPGEEPDLAVLVGGHGGHESTSFWP